LLLFGLGVLPSLVTDSGIGLIPIKYGSPLYTSIKTLYGPFGHLGWTDYGNVYLIVASFVLSVFVLLNRKRLNLNWVDYSILTVITLISGLFTLAFGLVAFALSGINI
jgi:hypothetical protein